MDVFLDLDDSIIKFVALSDNPDLQEAKELIQRLKKNQFYQLIYDSDVPLDLKVLNQTFGNHFISVRMKIPQPEVPTNIIFYDKDNNTFNIP